MSPNIETSPCYEWSDEYWLPLLKLYLEKPVGVKPLFSRKTVQVSMELHVPPRFIYGRMFILRNHASKAVRRVWEKYGNKPHRLNRALKQLKRMEGFGMPEQFYDGVEMAESFEDFFRPLTGYPELRPISLVLILDLYFRLTPNTMVPETPEVKAMAKLIGASPEQVAEVMNVFCFIDPYLKNTDILTGQLLEPCKKVWNRYGNGNPEELSAAAAQMKEFFK